MNTKTKILAAALATSLVSLSVYAEDPADARLHPRSTTPTTTSSSNDQKDGNADNTSRNTVDRDHNTLTPTDQGKSQADINTTQEIRKKVMHLKNLSVNGQNVKIITLNGNVTLRGPVESTEEKNRIEKAAQKIAGATNVSNQLEVK
ncbi:MAG: BON domain-containing protein [Verrucomicrobiota bacterium]